MGGNEVGVGRPVLCQDGPSRAAALAPGRFHRYPLGAAVPHEAPCGLPAAAPDGSAVRGRPPVLCPRPAPLHLSAARGRRRTPPASVVQGGGCTCRRDTAARARTRGPRKRSLSQRGQHVGADGPGGGRRTPESAGEPLTVPAARCLGPGR